MCKRCVFFMLIGSGLLVGAAATGYAWDEEEVSLDQVPPAVRQAILKLAGDAKIDEIERERKNGVVLYEAEWEVHGREAEVTLTASGEVIEFEEEVAASDVPDAVRQLAAKKFPGDSKITYERITMHFYEIEGKVAGRERELLVTPAGKILHAEDEDDDDHDHDGDHDDDHDKDHDHDGDGHPDHD